VCQNADDDKAFSQFEELGSGMRSDLFFEEYVWLECSLCPGLPDGGVSAPMKDRKNHETFISDSKEDRVRKASCDSLSHIGTYEWISIRMAGRSKHGLIDFSEELFTKSRALLVVPRGGLFHLVSRCDSKDDAEAH
jgi:hypothetical protein